MINYIDTPDTSPNTYDQRGEAELFTGFLLIVSKWVDRYFPTGYSMYFNLSEGTRVHYPYRVQLIAENDARMTIDARVSVRETMQDISEFAEEVL